MTRLFIRSAVVGLLLAAAAPAQTTSPGVKRKATLDGAFEAARTLGKPMFIVIENPGSS